MVLRVIRFVMESMLVVLEVIFCICFGVIMLFFGRIRLGM